MCSHSRPLTHHIYPCWTCTWSALYSTAHLTCQTHTHTRMIIVLRLNWFRLSENMQHICWLFAATMQIFSHCTSAKPHESSALHFKCPEAVHSCFVKNRLKLESLLPERAVISKPNSWTNHSFFDLVPGLIHLKNWKFCSWICSRVHLTYSVIRSWFFSVLFSRVGESYFYM